MLESIRTDPAETGREASTAKIVYRGQGPDAGYGRGRHCRR
jgi:hypothetical protein